MTETRLSEVAPRGPADEFAKRFALSSGNVYRCRATEVVPTIERIIAERSRGKSCYSKRVLEFVVPRVESSGSLEIQSAIPYDPSKDSDGLEVLSEVDVGITTADYGVAETGSLVEVSYSDSTKLLSSLSRVNVVLLREEHILPKLQDLAPVLRSILSTDDKPTVTLIGGPSRTGDIEMKMVLGVHGPHEVHAIIVSSS